MLKTHDAEYPFSISKLLDDGRNQCLLCPHMCKLKNGQDGLCMARTGSADSVILSAYGRITNIAVEPIEKKPIYHFNPGMKVLSVGGYGCNFDCNYCENFMVSQRKRAHDSKEISPESLVGMAVSKGCQGICFTYNEPIIYFEYISKVAEISSYYDIDVILKTNGFAEEHPWSYLCKTAHAMNMDWKGTNERYRKVAKADGTVILPRIKNAYESGVHIEISIPVYHDSDINEYEHFRDYVADISPNIPLHLLKIYPANRNNLVSVTSDLILTKVYDYLQERFNYVYISGMFGDKNNKYKDTTCSSCNTEVIQRRSLKSSIQNNNCCINNPIKYTHNVLSHC